MLHVDFALAAPVRGAAWLERFLVACSKRVEVKRCGGSLTVRPNQYLSTRRQIRHPKAVLVRHVLRRRHEVEPIDATSEHIELISDLRRRGGRGGVEYVSALEAEGADIRKRLFGSYITIVSQNCGTPP